MDLLDFFNNLEINFEIFINNLDNHMICNIINNFNIVNISVNYF